MSAHPDNDFAIIHVEKIKSFEEIDDVERHNSRLIKVINADKERAKANVDFRESKTKLTEKVKDFFAQIGIKPRKKSVLAFEVVLTFSPEMKGKIDQKGWAAENMKWAEERWGADNILHAKLHDDEKTPHIHLLVIPVLKHTGPRKFKNEFRLNFRELFGGNIVESKQKLSKLQDDYAAAMVKFGLRRGIKNSKRVRRTIKELYQETAILREEAEAEIKDFLTDFFSFQKKISQDSSQLSPAKRAAEQAATLEILRIKAEESFKKLIAKAETAWRADDLEAERKNFEKKLAEDQADRSELLANYQQTILLLEQIITKKDAIIAKRDAAIADLCSQARAVSVADVFSKLSGILPRETEIPGQKRFVFANGLRVVTDEKGGFRTETPVIEAGGTDRAKAGGRNAIDAVLFLKEWTFIEAVEWLASNFAFQEIGRTIAEMAPSERKEINKESAKAEIKALTKISVEAWSQVRDKLIGQGLDDTIIDGLRKAKWINANSAGHLICTKVDELPSPEPGGPVHEITGWLVQDPTELDPTIAYRLETGDNGHCKLAASKNPWVILTDDMLEAMAIATRELGLPPQKRSTIHAMGRAKSPRAEAYLRNLAKKFKTIIVAVSNTAAARSFVNWVQSIIPKAQILEPPKGWVSWCEYNRRPAPNVAEPTEITEPSRLRIVDEDFGS